MHKSIAIADAQEHCLVIAIIGDIFMGELMDISSR
jgi:hypothetical protein